MAADERERPSRGERLRAADDARLRRADVRQRRPVGRRAPDALEQRLDREDRCGEQDKVRAAHAHFQVRRGAIERAVAQGSLETRGIAADADERAGERRRPGRLRDRASEEPDTDDRERLDHAGFFPSTLRRALTSFRFSSGVPTVMRSAVSMPNGVIGRTITPWWRSF